MSAEKRNIKQGFDLSKEIQDMISGTYISWDKSKEQIWLEIEKKMEGPVSFPVRVFFRPLIRYAVAAAIILLIGFTVFMQLHTRTLRIPDRQQITVYLPDHSEVKINAHSVLSYKPLLYRFFRTLKLDGEAFFKVVAGKKFEVTSGDRKTVVLGTDFNIYARDHDYHVTCISGSVKVLEMTNNKEVILHQGQKAELSKDNVFNVQSDINTDQALSWLSNRLSFTSTPIRKVFEEIERQYGVSIQIDEDIDYIYTGNFDKNTSIENVLNLVCKPFNLKFTSKSRDEYIISRKK